MIFVQLIVQYLIATLTMAWMLMVGVGAAHHNWWAAMPTMGYGDAFSIVLAVTFPVAIIALIVWSVIVMIAASR